MSETGFPDMIARIATEALADTTPPRRRGAGHRTLVALIPRLLAVELLRSWNSAGGVIGIACLYRLCNHATGQKCRRLHPEAPRALARNRYPYPCTR